jgi:mono/diheme cytochrome c family protein
MRAPALAALLLLATGCEVLNPMMFQPKVKPYRKSEFHADGLAMRLPPAGTVPAGRPIEPAVATGRDAEGKPLARVPVAVTRDLLEVGKKRFDVFCAVCHGPLGDGRSPLARNMSIRPPPSLLDNPGRPDGFYFAAMTEGYGYMPSYAPWIDPGDRWALVAYIRALQLSQRARLDQAPPDVRARLEKESR